MFSESDQLAPPTLHHVGPTTMAARDTEAGKPSYFHRMVTRSKQQLRSVEGQGIMTATLEETVAGDPEEFPDIKTAYHFAECILSSEKASSDTVAFVDTIQQVRQGIDEAKRLYVSPAVSNFLEAYPSKQKWTMECLQEAQKVLNDIGTDIDPAWSRGEEAGTVALRRKFDWGQKNLKRLLKWQQQLNQCHIHLMGVIHVLQTAELCSKPGVSIQEPIYELPARPLVPHDEENTLRGPYSRQKHRLGSNYASVSSLTLALENDKDHFEMVSVNSTPAELAGSIPSELSESQGIQDFFFPQNSRESRENLTTGLGLPRRPRASSDHVRRTVASEVKSHTSIDGIVGRHDSVLITQPNVGIPMIARRCRAISVDIQSHKEEYKSLAQRPLVLKNQPSVVEDLADYQLPNMAVTRQSSEDGAALPTLSEINHSIHMVQGTIVMPSMANSAPRSVEESGNNRKLSKEPTPSRSGSESTQQHDHPEAVTSNNTCTNIESHRIYRYETSRTKQQPHHSSLTSTPQSSLSSLTLALSQDEDLVCRPSGQRPSQRKSKNIPNASKGSPESTTKLYTIGATMREGPQIPDSSNTNKLSAESADQTPYYLPLPMINADDACQPILATETELPEGLHDDVASSASLQGLLEEVETNFVAQNLQSSVLPVEQPMEPEQPVLALQALRGPDSSSGELESMAVPATSSLPAIATSGVSVPRPSENQEDPTGKKPMSAQAKRRAAHARRMQLAFGNVVDT